MGDVPVPSKGMGPGPQAEEEGLVIAQGSFDFGDSDLGNLSSADKLKPIT
jgi:hypothetical protein